MFSFYYTNIIVHDFRDNDPIMIKIKEERSLYEINPIDALTENTFISPGVSGLLVNVDDSYSKMKSLGRYDKNLLVFEEVEPSISIKNSYDRYIIGGNNTIAQTSLIVIAKDINYLEEIVKILNSKEVNATFFLDKKIFEECIDLIKIIASFGNDIELLSDNYSIYEVNKYNSILRLITSDKLSYCYLEEENEDILKNCKESKLQSIIPSIKNKVYLYGNVNNKLKNGSIISMLNNNTTVKELKSTISYIYQKGKKIVLLKKLLQE